MRKDLNGQTPYNPNDFLWINELMVHPNDGVPDPPGSLGDTLVPCLQDMFSFEGVSCGREWVELYNSHPCDAIDLSGYYFGAAGTGSNYGTFKFPEGTFIQPLDYLVIGGGDPSLASFRDINLNLYYNDPNHLWRSVTNSIWFLTPMQGNVFLFDPEGNPADHVYYNYDEYDPNFINDLTAVPNGIYIDPNVPPGAPFSYLPSLYEVYLANPSIVSYAGIYPGIGNSLKRTVDGGSNWVLTAVGAENPGACNGACAAEDFFDYSVTTTQSDCSAANGSINVQLLQGVIPPVTYFLNGVQVGLSGLSNLAAGDYHFTIMNGNGCYFEEDLVVPAPTIIISSPDYEMCIGDPVPDITVSGYGSITWYVINNSTGASSLGTSTQEVGANGEIISTYASNLFIPNGQGPITEYTHTFVVQFFDPNTGCAELDTLTFEIGSVPQDVDIDNVNTCVGQALVPVIAPNNLELNWYQNGQLVHQGDQFTPQVSNQSSGGYMYSVAVNSNGCSGPISNFLYTVSPASPNPTVMSPVSACSSEPVPSLTATGNSLHWFNVANGGTSLGVGNVFTPSINLSASSSFVFYVQSIPANGCPSQRVPVTINVVSSPTPPVVQNYTLCIGDPMPTITITGAGTVNWYNSPNGIPISTGSNFIPNISNPSLANSPYHFYASINNGGCESEKTEFLISFTQPEPPITTSDVVCLNDNSATMTASGLGVLNWYNQLIGGDLVVSGNSYSPNIAALGVGIHNYYVESVVGNCKSTRTLVSLTVESPPTINGQSISYCEGEIADPIILNTSYQINWYSALVGGSPLQSGLSFTPNISGLQGGQSISYFIEPSLNGCVGPRAEIVLMIKTPATINPTVVDASCGDTNGQVQNVLSSASGSILSLNWLNNGGQSVPHSNGDLINVASGLYTITYTDANNCTNEMIIEVGNSDGPVISGGTIVSDYCGLNLGGISGINIQSSIGYNMEWYNNSGIIIGDAIAISNQSYGTYTLIVTDDNNCSTSSAFEIGNLPMPSISGGLVTDDSCNSSNGSIDNVQLTNVSVDASIEWQTQAGQIISGQGGSVSNLSVGNYTLWIEDNGCVISQSYTVTNVAGPEILNVITSPATCNNSDGSVINVVVNNAVISDYYWYNSSNQLIASGVASLTDLAPGSYVLTVGEGTNCVVQYPFLIESLNAPVISGGSVTSASCGEDNGAINGFVINPSSATIQIQWFNSVGELIGTDLDINNIGAGNYVLTITDENDCQTSESFQIQSENGPEILDYSIINPSCGQSDGSIMDLEFSTTISSLVWTDSNGQIVGTQANITELSAGLYVMEMTDENGCQLIQQFELVDVAGPEIVSAEITHANCDDEDGNILNILINTTNTITSYSWTLENETEVFNIEAELIYVSSGTYVLTVMDENGCTDSQSFEVDSAVPPVISNGIIQDANCGIADGSITGISLSSNIQTISWTNQLNQQIGDEVDLLNINAGVYTLQIIDDGGCQTSQDFIVASLDGPQIVSGEVVNAQCGESNGQIINIVIDNGASLDYNWYNDNNVLISSQQELTSISSGDYTLVISDSGGCSDQYLFQVSDSQAPVIVSAEIENASCGLNIGSIQNVVYNAQSSISYAWYDNNQVLMGNAEVLDNLPEGTYTLVITDELGCEASQDFEIDNANGPNIQNAQLINTTCGNQNGAIDNVIVELNGSSEIYYSWTDQNNATIANSENINNLSVGNYTLTITNEIGCTDSQSFNVEAIDPITIISAFIQNASCGMANGSINNVLLSATMDNGGYAWYNSDNMLLSNDSSLTSLDAGTYTLVITDANGCEDAMSFEVSQLAGPIIISGNVNPSSCNENNGSINEILVDNGNGDLLYNWYNAGILVGQGLTLSNLSVGTYTLEVIDQEGCVDEMDFVVDELPLPSLEVQVSGDLSCAITEVELQSSLPQGQYTYQWYYNDEAIPTADQNSLTVNTSGNYLLEVTELSTLCVVTASIVVTEELSNPIVEAGEDIVLYNNIQNQSLVGSILQGPTDNYLIEWLDPNGNIISTGTSMNAIATIAGDYTIRLTDMNTGCVGQDVVNISVITIDFQLLHLPSAFSPNGDSVNDRFRLLGDYIASAEMQIYDRWGKKLYESDDATSGWNGIYNGYECEIGVYVYCVNVIMVDGSSHQLKGNVTLLR